MNNSLIKKSIIDYRLFDVCNFNTPIIAFIFNNNFIDKIMKLFEEIEACIIIHEDLCNKGYLY